MRLLQHDLVPLLTIRTSFSIIWRKRFQGFPLWYIQGLSNRMGKMSPLLARLVLCINTIIHHLQNVFVEFSFNLPHLRHLCCSHQAFESAVHILCMTVMDIIKCIKVQNRGAQWLSQWSRHPVYRGYVLTAVATGSIPTEALCCMLFPIPSLFHIYSSDVLSKK